MSQEDCPRCFGSGEEFDGEKLKTCTKCQGSGSVIIGTSEDDSEDEFPFQEFSEDDFEEFDEDKHSPLD